MFNYWRHGIGHPTLWLFGDVIVAGINFVLLSLGERMQM